MPAKSISIKEIAQKVIRNQKAFILDVRKKGDFDDWKVEGKSVEVFNTPYTELMEGIDPIVDHLPKNEPIYVICSKGNSSKKVADQIADHGYEDVYSIEGGMQAWSEHLEPIKVGDLKDGGSIYQFVRIGKGCLSYFIESNGEAAIVDTTRMTDVFKEFAKQKGVSIKALIDTHLHADHISGGRQLAESVGADYYLPPRDAKEVTFDYTPLEEGKDIEIGHSVISLQPIYTPGHTIGSTSLIVDDSYLLTGDILFIDSIGRPDLAGKAGDWADDLRNTLYSTYKSLGAELIVLPAHFMTIKEMNEDGSVAEKLGVLYKENHGLNIEDEDEFRKAVSENLPPQPNAYQEIRKTNMGKIYPNEDEQREMEIGPNRCAIK
ncbi:MBL fold metallo-hydrolase [Rossellomorea aquimaris]|uniref:MBL fold metallo-hydrolase n=1 Tax=Rossellomorea aquimaris TaxID=189382 RepID=UPI001CD31197|nr:MBL fold metallo-hydrolase [Rossellomorea aquimaris]MCA1053867.1 MBL fold metallo-hydrolase [Rossellomorea aquimaris]